MKKLYKDKEWLYRKYIKEKLSTTKIGKLSEIGNETICRWLKKYNIPIRSRVEGYHLFYTQKIKNNKYCIKKNNKYCNRKWLYQKYIVERLSAVKISKICGINDVTIGKWLREHNIPIHTHYINHNNSLISKYMNKEWLNKKSVEEKLTITEIAKLSKLSCSTIYKYLRKYDTPIYSIKKVREKGKFIGEKAPGWKGGRHIYGDYVEVWISPNSPFASMTNTRHIVEHRLVMAKHLNRCLEPWEIVHHINGIKTDNRIENLELVKVSEHYILHRQNNLLKKEVRKLRELLLIVFLSRSIKVQEGKFRG